MDRPSTQVLIVGAGIGGLSLALLLHRRGIDCRIVEAAAQLQELGAGINLLPQAMVVLAEMGLAGPLAEAGVAVQELRFYSRHGQLVHTQPRGLAAGHAYAQIAIHRASLQALLLRAVRDRLGARSLQLNTRCMDLQQSADGVSARLVDAHNGRSLPPMHAAFAVGCDGIHSRVRAQMHGEGAADPTRYAGIAMWRGVARGPRFLDGHCMVLAGALDVGKIVVYPIRDAEKAEPLLNWVAEKRMAQVSLQDWQALGERADLEWLQRDWKIAGLDVPSLVSRTEVLLRYPMVDKDPLPFWTQGRVTLLGDAAHPMYPFGSNGACQAILDAATLADCLAEGRDPAPGSTAALQRYEEIRRPATANIVLLNRRSSPDSLLEEVDRRSAGQFFDDIECLLPAQERSDLLRGYSQSTAGTAGAAEQLTT